MENQSNLEKEISKEENLRIIEFFKENKFSTEEIRIYCLAYADAMLYIKSRAEE
jgi:hypothetical protein